MSAPEPEKLRRLAAMLILQPCPHNPGSETTMGECVNCCARLLERVVRECAAKSRWPSDEYGILRAFGLSPSPESPKEGK